MLNLDHAMRFDPPKELADNAGADAKRQYGAEKEWWDDSNRKCLLVIKGSISEGIRVAVPDRDKEDNAIMYSAKEYLGKVDDQFKGSSKTYANTLIQRLVNNKYDGTVGMREHIMRMCNTAAKLKEMKMDISDGFPVYFIMTSLSKEFSQFTINYNAMKDKWSIDKLMAMCVQEEERLKAQRIDYVNQAQDELRKHEYDLFKPKKQQFKKKGQQPPPDKSKWLKESGETSDQRTKPNGEKEGCHFVVVLNIFRETALGFLKCLNKRGNTYLYMRVL